MPADAELRMVVSGPNFNDPDVSTSTNVVVPLGEAGEGTARLERHGLLISLDEDKARFEEPLPGSKFESLSSAFDFYTDAPVLVSRIDLPNERMAKEMFYIPAFGLLAIVVGLQLRRRRVEGD